MSHDWCVTVAAIGGALGGGWVVWSFASWCVRHMESELEELGRQVARLKEKR